MRNLPCRGSLTGRGSFDAGTPLALFARSMRCRLGLRCVLVGAVAAAPRAAWAADELGRDRTSNAFEPQFALYGELGGSAVVTSINAELRPVEFLNLRVGGVVVPLLGGVWPVTVTGASFLVGGERHHFEAGLNYTHVWMDDDDARFFNPVMGYRYQPTHGGFVFRATVTPLIRANDTSDVLPWLGVSFGGCTAL